MKLNQSNLKAVCFEYAKSVMWDRKPTDLVNIQSFADLVYDSAIFHVEFIEGQDRDPNLITECVRYLAWKHAIPPLRDDISFVINALEVLVELACPNMSSTPEQKMFFREISLGITKAEAETQ